MLTNYYLDENLPSKGGKKKKKKEKKMKKSVWGSVSRMTFEISGAVGRSH